jgi:hypothetical protein
VLKDSKVVRVHRDSGEQLDQQEQLVLRVRREHRELKVLKDSKAFRVLREPKDSRVVRVLRDSGEQLDR